MKFRNALRNGQVLVVLSALLCAVSATETLATEYAQYRGNPLSISLSVGQERRVTFPHAVYVDVPETVMTSLKTQIVGGDIYWTAIKPFPAIRMVVGEEGGNRVYLVNLQGVVQDEPLPQQLVISESKTETQTKTAIEEQSVSAPGHNSIKKTGYGGLFRHAAVALYAPARIRVEEQNTEFSSAPIPTGRIHHLIKRHQLETYAMSAWRSESHTITALSVRNVTNYPVVLDPRDLRGEILAARFDRSHLSPSDTPGDTTTLFVITRRSFVDSFSGYAVRIDPPVVDHDGTNSSNSKNKDFYHETQW